MWGQRASDISVRPDTKNKKHKQNEIVATIFIRITAISLIVLSEFKQPGWTTSYSYSRSLICLWNLLHFTTAGYAPELLHFICQCLIFLQNWSRLAACAGRTYIYWLAVCVLQRSILFVSLLSAIILFGSAYLFIDRTIYLQHAGILGELGEFYREGWKRKDEKKGTTLYQSLLIVFVLSWVLGVTCFTVFMFYYVLWICWEEKGIKNQIFTRGW